MTTPRSTATPTRWRPPACRPRPTAPAAAQRVLVPEREWSDATGMFKVQASLVGIEGTALTLRQTDGTDLTIELDQLAPLDQLIARRTIRRLAHRGEGPPQVEAFDTAARATNHTDFPPLVPEPLAADPADAAITTAQVDWAGTPVTAAIWQGGIAACQFHPEKSGPVGEAMLGRWLSWLQTP